MGALNVALLQIRRGGVRVAKVIEDALSAGVWAEAQAVRDIVDAWLDSVNTPIGYARPVPCGVVCRHWQEGHLL